MFVLDATPLIYLATVDRLDLLDELPADPVVPDPVYEEVVTAGVEAGHPDARRIERAVEEGALDTRAVPDTELRDRLRENPNLSDADAAVIALADARDGTALMDEQYGRAVADTEGVDTRGTAWIVLSLVRDGHLPAAEARDVIDGMVDAGWYCSTALYTRLMDRLDTLEARNG